MENLINLVKENITIEGDLQNTYFDILESNILDYETLEDIKNYMENEAICGNGSVGGLIYYSETDEIFKNHFDEIFEMIEELKIDFGGDFLNNIELNANNLVWLTFDETVRNWYYEIEDLEVDEEEIA